jgi:branched-chain amino acid transport system ATP-binding protein
MGAPVLNGITCSIDKGEIFGISGINGIGKTTLVKAISNTFGQENAEVVVDKMELTKTDLRNLNSMERYEQGIHTSFEGRRLFGSLTVRENLICASMKGSKTELDSKIERVVDKIPFIKDILDRKASLCSGGQQQMVSLARSIVEPVSLLVLDEPTLGLSPSSINEIASVLNELIKDSISILIVEQREKFIDDISTRKYEMVEGILC